MPPHVLDSAPHPVSPAHTESAVLRPVYSSRPRLPAHTSRPPPGLSLACTHFGLPPLPGAHRELCARSHPLVLCLQSASDGFWKSVATRVPKEPPEIRILNPYFIQEAAFTLIGLPFNNGLMGRRVRRLDLGRGRRGWGPEVPWQGRTEGRVGIEGSVPTSGAQLRGALLRVSASLYPPSPSFQNIPTLGSVAVTMALHGCDEVAVAGFGYDMSTPNAPLHYYETVRMAAIKEVRGWVRGSPWAGQGRGQCQHEG